MKTIPGKIPYIKKVRLRVVLTAGSMIDQQRWISIHHHEECFGNQYPSHYSNIKVQITLDNQVVLQGSADQDLELCHEFLDSDDTVAHCVRVDVSGFDEEFCTHVDGIGEVAPMIKISAFEIEDLNMMRALEDLGQCAIGDQLIASAFMGQNGHQLLNFTTPIYAWLLQHGNDPNYYL